MKRILVLMLLTASVTHVKPAEATPVRLLSRDSAQHASQAITTPGSHSTPVAADNAVQRNSIGGWWNRTKRALHHLSGCTLASAGITYAFIAGVTIPGAGLIGLAGASVVVAVCL